MNEKIIEKKSVFKSKTGAELSEKMVAYFKKYTIPDMLENDKKNGISNQRAEPYDILKIFDGNLPLFNH